MYPHYLYYNKNKICKAHLQLVRNLTNCLFGSRMRSEKEISLTLILTLTLLKITYFVRKQGIYVAD